VKSVRQCIVGYEEFRHKVELACTLPFLLTLARFNQTTSFGTKWCTKIYPERKSLTMHTKKTLSNALSTTSSSTVKVAVPRILESEVRTTHLLGEGAYGQVWKGTCRSNPVAVKYIHPEKYNPESFLAELTILFQVCSRSLYCV
jgi:hypothetical protein